MTTGKLKYWLLPLMPLITPKNWLVLKRIVLSTLNFSTWYTGR